MRSLLGEIEGMEIEFKFGVYDILLEYGDIVNIGHLWRDGSVWEER